jgi:hypothetical protein
MIRRCRDIGVQPLKAGYSFSRLCLLIGRASSLSSIVYRAGHTHRPFDDWVAIWPRSRDALGNKLIRGADSVRKIAPDAVPDCSASQGDFAHPTRTANAPGAGSPYPRATPWFFWPVARRGTSVGHAALHVDEADLVHQAVGDDRIAIRVYGHVAHDVAAARDCPGLEFFGLGIEAHDGVRAGG